MAAQQQQQHQQAQDQQQATMQAQAQAQAQASFIQQQQALQNQQAAHAAAQNAQTPQQTPQMIQRTRSAAPPQSSPPMPPVGGDTTQRWDVAFKQLFGQWITSRKIPFEQPYIDGKPVDLSKLFLTVGALGGMKKVTEDNAWSIIGGFVGFPYQSLPGRQTLLSHPDISLKLRNIYQATLADFQEHWYNSFRDRDDSGVPIPLPPQLQFLRPTINELARRALSRQDPSAQQATAGAGQNPRGPTPVQQPQQPQIPQSVQLQQRLIMGSQQSNIAPPPPAVGQRPMLSNLTPQQLTQLMSMTVEQMKGHGFKDEQVRGLHWFGGQGSDMIHLLDRAYSGTAGREDEVRLEQGSLKRITNFLNYRQIQQQRVSMAQAQNAAAVAAHMNNQAQNQAQHNVGGGMNRPPSSLGMPPDQQQQHPGQQMMGQRAPTPSGALPPALASLRTGHTQQEILDSRTYVHSLMVNIQNQRKSYNLHAER